MCCWTKRTMTPPTAQGYPNSEVTDIPLTGRKRPKEDHKKSMRF